MLLLFFAHVFHHLDTNHECSIHCWMGDSAIIEGAPHRQSLKEGCKTFIGSVYFTHSSRIYLARYTVRTCGGHHHNRLIINSEVATLTPIPRTVVSRLHRYSLLWEPPNKYTQCHVSNTCKTRGRRLAKRCSLLSMLSCGMRPFFGSTIPSRMLTTTRLRAFSKPD